MVTFLAKWVLFQTLFLKEGWSHTKFDAGQMRVMYLATKQPARFSLISSKKYLISRRFPNLTRF